MYSERDTLRQSCDDPRKVCLPRMQEREAFGVKLILWACLLAPCPAGQCIGHVCLVHPPLPALPWPGLAWPWSGQCSASACRWYHLGKGASSHTASAHAPGLFAIRVRCRPRCSIACEVPLLFLLPAARCQCQLYSLSGGRDLEGGGKYISPLKAPRSGKSPGPRGSYLPASTSTHKTPRTNITPTTKRSKPELMRACKDGASFGQHPAAAPAQSKAKPLRTLDPQCT